MARRTPSKNENPNDRTISTNRKARHRYEILDTLECGIALKGSEVKSLRDWSAALDRHYQIDGPGLWPSPNSADEVNDTACEAPA